METDPRHPSLLANIYELLTKLGSYGYRYLKTARIRHPDCLADSCKHSSINQMAADPVKDFFSPTFQTFCTVKGFRPTGIQVLPSTRYLNHIQITSLQLNSHG